MITELSAQNFKSWQDTGKLQFAPLTGFFGTNNSGKTSILQLLLLLKQTTEDRSNPNVPLHFGDDKSPVNLVNFDTVIHRHKQELSLSISVSWKLPEQINIERDLTNFLSFSTSIDKKYGLGGFRYTLGERDFGIEWTPQGYHDISTRQSANPFRCYGVDDFIAERKFLSLQEAFENLFSRVHYLGPRREDPRRYYTWKESHPKGIGQYGENMFSALLSGRVRQRSIDEWIMNWLRELELIYSYTLNPTSNTEQGYELLVQQYEDGPEVGLTDVGFGVSQVLPVLTLCYYAPESSILILEQPEAHLHPKAQSGLADVLIDVVKNQNVQIILESHSEHLLLRLMRRIAEGEECKEGISVDKTAFHFCEINDGNSKAEQLKVDEYGNISNWPQNFFGDDMGDLAEKTKAEMKRRKANK